MNCVTVPSGIVLGEADAAIRRLKARSKWMILWWMAALVLLIVTNRPVSAQQQQQPLQSFGYVGVANYLRSHPGQPVAADWDFFGADPPADDVDAIVDLTGTLDLLQRNIQEGAAGQPSAQP